MSVNLHLRHGDCLVRLQELDEGSIGAVVSDPPYELSFMGKGWDGTGIAYSPVLWAHLYRVLALGGVVKAFSATRTYHRMAAAMQGAGFTDLHLEAWSYGSGFPKSLNIGKMLDKHGGTPPSWFGPWFRAWREENKITQKQVAALFPSKTGNLTGCVANWELGFNIPTPEQFNLIRDTFGLPFASIEAAEREVLGHKAWSNSKAHFTPGEDHTRRVRLDVTAPATREAHIWDGWGTALKPAWEPVLVGRKPL
jgi:transcriptional regulator with XRE-family HTH domain